MNKEIFIDYSMSDTYAQAVPGVLSAPHLDALVPLTAALVSAGLFSTAIQLPYRARLLMTPLIISAAVISIWTNSNLRLIPNGPDICCQVICIWIHHALSVLLIEPIYIPPSLPRNQRRRFIRKIWNDPRRLTTWESCAREADRRGGAVPRLRFFGKALIRVMFYAVLHRGFALLSATIGPNELVADDFAPSRRILLRRIFDPSTETPITAREMHIRAWMSVEWIWSSYLKISAYNVSASILFVSVLQLDSPEEWPSLFGSPLEAYSIQRFWGKFWHSLLRHPCGASGRLISRKVLRLPMHSRYEKIWLAFWTFFISSVNHAVGAYAMGYEGTLADSVRFRLSNFVAGAIEAIVGPFLVQMLHASQKRLLGKAFAGDVPKRVFGYIWVFSVFFWIKPQERYAKMYANLE